MNRRLITPVIVLASFAGTFGLMSWRAGLWRAAPMSAAVTPAARAARSIEAIKPAQPEAAAAPALQLPDAAPPEPEAVPAAVTAAVPTDEFLAARDRAAAHSSRSH